MYPVGWPLWKLAARAGLPLRFTLVVNFDPEACVFWGQSPDLDGLVVEAPTLQELHREALLAADLLLELQLSAQRAPKLQIRPELDMSTPWAAA